MSPPVRSVIDPDGDGAFSAHVQTDRLTIDVPAEYTPEQVVDAIERHLRRQCPSATIRFGPATADEFDATWQVYREWLQREP